MHVVQAGELTVPLECQITAFGSDPFRFASLQNLPNSNELFLVQGLCSPKALIP